MPHPKWSERKSLCSTGGGHLDPKFLPQRAVDVDNRKKKLGHLFKVNGFVCMTEKAAAILRQFNLGSGGLYPLELVRHDGVTPVDGFFWAHNFGEKKNALVVDESREISGSPKHGYFPELTLKDDDIALTTQAFEGADIWGDEKLRSGFFVSSRLGHALQKAGLAKVFHLMRCRIVRH